MKKFLIFAILCAAFFACKNEESPNRYSIDYVHSYSFFVAVNVENKTAGDVNVDFFRLEKRSGNGGWSIPVGSAPLEQRKASSKSESRLVFENRAFHHGGASLSCRHLLSFAVNIGGKTFAGTPVDEELRLVDNELNECDFADADKENSWLGVVHFDGRDSTVDSKYGEFYSPSDIPVVHYNVVITDENVDFSFDRVEFVNANEIPSEYWN